MDAPFSISKQDSSKITAGFSDQLYCIFIFQGHGQFTVDGAVYSFSGKTILFLSPYQKLRWLDGETITLYLIQFHGDFYCIEYHKKEVACNGLLFNNVYLKPHIPVSQRVYDEIVGIFQKIKNEKERFQSFSESVVKTYIQLILALCSREKNLQLKNPLQEEVYDEHAIAFQELIEKHFQTERTVKFYASELAITSNMLSKKVKKTYGKTPKQLIQERVILEAKKLLHLSYRSIKEIAAILHFEDEFYFSRYFKESTGLSPLHYRKKVGISIVAQKPMD